MLTRSPKARAAHRPTWRPLLLAVFALGAQPVAAQIRTVLVSPVPGNPVASGNALQSALLGIAPAPTATNPWLVKLEPGLYDVGATPLAMRPWVHIEGSGIGITTIRGSVDGSGLIGGTVQGASNSELRQLTVEANHPQGAIALYNPGTSPRLYRVRFVATGQLAWGIRNASAAPLIEECDITATSTGGSGSIAYGVVYSAALGLPAGRSAIRRGKIAVTGGASNYGVYLDGGLSLTELRDSRLDATGGGNNYGLYAADPSWQGTENLFVRDTEIYVGGGSGSAYGARFEVGTSLYLTVDNSRIFASSAPQTVAVSHTGAGAVGVRGSHLLGLTKVAEASGSMIVTSSEMHGGPTTALGWLGCVGVWDELAVFYAGSACPQ